MPSIPLNQVPRLIGCDRGDLDDTAVVAVTEDSRRVVPGALFVATAGQHTDGHAFAEQAVASGAVAILGDRTGLASLHGKPYLRVDRPRRACGILAHALHGNPSESLSVIGVTGTNGKSSTVALIHAVLRHAGHRPASFGTLGYEVGGKVDTAKLTTPFGEDLAALFARARDAGDSHIVMEASSIALEQDRVAGIQYSVAAFTNFTQDHLDYHPDMEAYLAAKLLLFRELVRPGAFGVVNRDDPQSGAFEGACAVPCYTYGLGRGKHDCRAELVRLGERDTQFRALTPWGEAAIRLQLLGRHNIANALCAVAVCGGLGVPMEGIDEGIASLASVPGRFEHVEGGAGFQVIVDYAHTEDGLRNVLQAARAICKKRVICVFGCGGDRDKTKRPKMGAASAELADFSILTSDNPRTEDPARILLDIEVGVQHAGKRKGDDYVVIEDRASAIAQALEMASPGDVVLIAGKGHEDYQILGTERIHFDDREIARALLAKR